MMLTRRREALTHGHGRKYIVWNVAEVWLFVAPGMR